MNPSPRTTDPLLAIQALLSSEEPNPVISYDGLLYHIRDATEEPDKGSFQILTRPQASRWSDSRCPIIGGEFRNASDEEDLAWWLSFNAQTWLASARLAVSWEDPSTQIDTALRAISHD
jgi:hypothetical protein